MVAQCSLKHTVRARGIGLHTGARVVLSLRPAPPDTGIVFRRTDLSPPAIIPAAAENVGELRLSSTLTSGTAKIHTVEHLMSAFFGLGMDNVYVDVDGPEVPIMDGSAAPFIFLIQAAGMVEQDRPRRMIEILKPIEAREEEGKWARLDPYDGFSASFTISYPHPFFGGKSHTLTFDLTSQSYILEIARARTFGFLCDIERLRRDGLIKGGSLENAIVVGEREILNAGGLRFADEFVRHKVLDAMGDLYLLGHPICGAFSANKSGHALNNKLLRALLGDPSAWRFVAAPETFRFPDERRLYA